MPRELSAGALVFRRNKEIKYLLLNKEANNNYKESWDFPKGNVEENEDEIETAKREVKEETGIEDINLIKGFREKIRFFYRKGSQVIYKEVIFYLIETKQEKAKVSFEHSSYKWFNYNEALKILTFKNSKEILKKANNFLIEREKSSLAKFLK